MTAQKRFYCSKCGKVIWMLATVYTDDEGREFRYHPEPCADIAAADRAQLIEDFKALEAKLGWKKFGRK